MKQVLVPVDGTPASEQAARVAIGFAKRAKATLLFAFVVGKRGSLERQRTSRRFGQALLEGWVREAQTQGVEAALTLASDLNVAYTLARIAETEPCELIVVGTHGREGWQHAIWGSVAEHLADLTAIPVMFVRHTERPITPDFDHVLVAIDVDAVSDAALDQASAVAKQLGSRLEVLHVIPNVPISPLAYETGVTWDQHAEVEALRNDGEDLISAAWTRVRSGSFDPVMLDIYQVEAQDVGVPNAILEQAKIKHAGLVVMGTNARRGLEKFLLGSVAESVIHHAQVPVLVVRAQTVKANVEEVALEQRRVPSMQTAFPTHARRS